MAKITRYSGNLLAFGTNSTGTNRTVFGDVAQSDALDDNVNSDYLLGWEIVGSSEVPSKQDFNALGFTQGQLLAYLFQTGVPEWDNAQEYHYGSNANRYGIPFTSLVDSNTGNDPAADDASNWVTATPGHVVSSLTELQNLLDALDAVDITQANGRKVFIASADGGEGTIVTGAALATYANDGGSYCGTQRIPTGGDGSAAWVRKFTGLPSVKWWGALGDETANESTAFLSAATEKGRVSVPPGVYKLNVLDLPDGAQFIGEGENSVLKAYDTTDRGILGCDSGSDSVFIDNLIFKNIKFLGTVESEGFLEPAHLIWLNGAKNCTIENCIFEGPRGDAIYLGNGLGATKDRHNINVTIRNNLIDGKINDNRNGISVIDGDNIYIVGNTFQNLSRSGMPGSIDIENDDTLQSLKNIKIINNHFYNSDGDFGHLGLFITTTDYGNFLFSGNTFDTASKGVTVRLSTTSDPHNIVIKDNFFTGLDYGLLVDKGNLQGLLFSGNQVVDSQHGVYMTDATADALHDYVTIRDNYFSVTGGSGGTGLLFGGIGATENNRVWNIDGNTFLGTATTDIKLSGTSTQKIKMTNNMFQSSGQTNCVEHTATTKNGLTNTFRNNTVAAPPLFYASDTDFAGAAEDVYDSTNIPSDFSGGEHTSVSVSDATLPDATAEQGVLKTFVHTDYSSDPEFIYQMYYPAATEGADIDDFYFRYAATASTWHAWYRVTGV